MAGKKLNTSKVFPNVVGFGVTVPSWKSLDKYLPHLYRRHNVSVYDPVHMSVTSTDIYRVQRGMGKFLEQFFIHKNYHDPDYPSNWPLTEGDLAVYYTKAKAPIPIHTPSYQLRPETFIDNRPDHIIEHAAMLGFVPGNPPVSYLGEWPLWTQETDYSQPRKVGFTYTQEVLDAMYQICLYWHITTAGGYRPKSQIQACAGLLEAIGSNYLQHPLLQTIEHTVSPYMWRKINA